MAKQNFGWTWIWSALGLGLYYTLAIVYFEPFHVDGLRQSWTGGEWSHGLGFYLPVWAVLTGVSILLVYMQLRDVSRPGMQSRVRRWLVLPLGAYLTATGLLLLYGQVYSGGNADLYALAVKLSGILALVGLLPLQLLLLGWPKFKQAAKESNTETNDRQKTQVSSSEGVPDKSSGTEQNNHDAHPGLIPNPVGQSTGEKTQALPIFRLQPSHGESVFEINARDFILAEAADNYCKLYFLQDGQARTKMVRVTMREVEAALMGMSGYYRCHRSFVVNGQMVEAVQGQSQAYRLKVRHVQEAVPVSRSFDVSPLRPA